MACVHRCMHERKFNIYSGKKKRKNGQSRPDSLTPRHATPKCAQDVGGPMHRSSFPFVYRRPGPVSAAPLRTPGAHCAAQIVRSVAQLRAPLLLAGSTLCLPFLFLYSSREEKMGKYRDSTSPPRVLLLLFLSLAAARSESDQAQGNTQPAPPSSERWTSYSATTPPPLDGHTHQYITPTNAMQCIMHA